MSTPRLYGDVFGPSELSPRSSRPTSPGWFERVRRVGCVHVAERHAHTTSRSSGILKYLRTWPECAAAEPGYRVLRIAPTLLNDLDDASAWHETPHGMASAGWCRDGDQVRFRAQVPPNARAIVELPSGETYDVGSGVHTWVEHHPRGSRSRNQLSLATSLAAIVDDPEAYQAARGDPRP